jgi:hypothetical protein
MGGGDGGHAESRGDVPLNRFRRIGLTNKTAARTAKQRHLQRQTIHLAERWRDILLHRFQR